MHVMFTTPQTATIHTQDLPNGRKTRWGQQVLAYVLLIPALSVFAVFGWYRIAAAAVVVLLVAGGILRAA